jgi:hypothetical protein
VSVHSTTNDRTLHVLTSPATCRRLRCRRPAVYEVRYQARLNQSGMIGERRDPVCDVHAKGRIDHLPSFILALTQVVVVRALGGDNGGPATMTQARREIVACLASRLGGTTEKTPS